MLTELLTPAFLQVVSEKDVLLGAAKGALEVGARAVEAAKVVLEPAIAVLSAANVSINRPDDATILLTKASSVTAPSRIGPFSLPSRRGRVAV